MTCTPEQWNNGQDALWRHWTDWTPFNAELGGALPQPGAYVLGLKRNGRPATIYRLLGIDKSGTLDIGQTTNLKVRLHKLWRCVSADDVRGHSAGWRYRDLRLHERLGGELQISWRNDPNCYALEGATMKAYVEAFGELPPLNYSYNRSAHR